MNAQMADDEGTKQSVSARLTESQESELKEYLSDIKEKIVAQAQKGAKEGSIKPKDLLSAINLYVPGSPVTETQSLRRRFLGSITAVTLLSAILALFFGVYGLLAEGNPAFVDIAKIFAGAIVGSAAATQLPSRSES